MKLSFFLMDLGGGGAERVMLNLAQGLIRHNIEVDLVLAQSVGAYINQIPDGVRLVCLNASRLASSLPPLVKYLRQHQPEVLISALEDTNFIALTAIKLSATETLSIVTVHNNLSKESKNHLQLKRRLTPFLVRFFYPSADAIVGVSDGVVRDLVRIGIPKDKTHRIYNPIVTEELLNKAKKSIAHPWFETKDIPVVVGAGRLTKQKDYPTLLRAIAKVREDTPVRLIVLGEGDERASLEQLAKSLNLSNDVDFLGFVDNPYAYMKRADLLVLTSAWEGFGNVLVESMAVGTPVISTNCESGPREILNDGEYGRLVSVGDFEDLAKSIIQSLKDSPDPAILKMRANEFTLDATVEQYLQVLKSLA